MGKNPLLEIALECERIALEDDYFIKRKLYPNVDFYTGLIYQSMGFPMTMFPVLFAIPRTSGWISQWEELLLDRNRRSLVRGKSTWATIRATTCQSTNVVKSAVVPTLHFCSDTFGYAGLQAARQLRVSRYSGK